MPKTRQVGALDGTGHAVVVTEPVPPLAKGCLLVETHASLISPGTELSQAKLQRKDPAAQAGQPRPFGYQNAGVVLKVGEGVKEFKPGDRVACMGAGARHANYCVVPKNLCARMPDNVSFEQGAFCHLAMTSLHAVRRGEPELGENLLVVGLGLVGQMAARLGQIAGMYVMGWDIEPFRCELAKRWGIDDTAVVGQEDETAKARAFTRNLGFDMAVMAFGGDGTKAFQSVKNVMLLSPDTHQMGRICLVGGLRTELAWGANLGNLDLRCCSRTGPGYHDDPWEVGEIEYPPVFIRWTTRSNMEYVLRLMSEGKFDVNCLVSHRLPLSKIDEAVTAHIDQPNATMGTLLLMDHDR
ncbi:MAG TPA: alcohol dehydrogenase catalytic domain-containing protein [Candidatus Brocadiia bacterium]|nr:alcohol dehydrogenase catalytic domain-containing protein [Candidatus Brocadiia bacterium]